MKIDEHVLKILKNCFIFVKVGAIKTDMDVFVDVVKVEP